MLQPERSEGGRTGELARRRRRGETRGAGMTGGEETHRRYLRLRSVKTTSSRKSQDEENHRERWSATGEGREARADLVWMGLCAERTVGFTVLERVLNVHLRKRVEARGQPGFEGRGEKRKID